VIKPVLNSPALLAVDAFRDALAAWFSRDGRDYPWRRTRDPYAVLVSEVMLQQTQIATVLGKGYYERFLRAFPDVATLAAAEDEPLLKVWEGLGYYRRARMLRATARAVIEDHDGKFPVGHETLMKLPGVGRYTAGAVRAFAFDAPAAVVDGNVARVLARLTDFREPVDDPPGARHLWTLAESLADARRSRIYNSAIMELGQTFCRPAAPACGDCPVAEFCETRTPGRLPVKRRKTGITPVTEHVIWVRDEKGRLLMRREDGRRREGLWRLPARSPREVRRLPLLAEAKYTITRFRVTLRAHAGGSPEEGDQWVAPEELARLPMPSPYRKMVERLFGMV
jgi:A/G-specific adenine glycosylase